MNRVLLQTISILLIFCAVHVCRATDTWKAGVSRTVITPSQPMWMAGFASRERPAEGTLNDLWAKALVIEDADGHRAVIVTLDLVGISGELSSSICNRIQERYGLARSQIALATSHTHSGPIIGDLTRFIYFLNNEQSKLVNEYATFLSDRIDAVVGEAMTNIGPATLQYGMGHATFAVNRRNNVEADVPQLRQNNQLQGPYDHEMPVLTVRRDGELSAILFGYACHATVLLRRSNPVWRTMSQRCMISSVVSNAIRIPFAVLRKSTRGYHHIRHCRKLPQTSPEIKSA